APLPVPAGPEDPATPLKAPQTDADDSDEEVPAPSPPNPLSHQGERGSQTRDLAGAAGLDGARRASEGAPCPDPIQARRASEGPSCPSLPERGEGPGVRGINRRRRWLLAPLAILAAAVGGALAPRL